MQNLSPEGLRVAAEAAKRHGVSPEAAALLLGALAEGDGRQAQFNHPDLGGMGQWSEGGMVMVGDMFNSALKLRVDALCNELAALLRSEPSLGRSEPQVSLLAPGSGSGERWWPAELGSPASTGAQNDMRYAFFPNARRLAIKERGQVHIYDAGDHRLSGFSQQQGGDQSLTFTSQFGLVRVADLPLVHSGSDEAREEPPSRSAQPPQAPAPAPANDDVLKTIERLAELRRKDILTEEEFSAKKAELLGRL